MIETIRFNNVLPNVFVGSPPEGGPTDVWEKELSFKKGCSYLIEAASGRGKSSFCSFLYGLRSDYQGRIELLDKDGHALGSTEKDSNESRSFTSKLAPPGMVDAKSAYSSTLFKSM